MRGMNGRRFAVGMGLCLIFPILNGCQEPGGRAASSAPVVSAPVPSASASDSPTVGLAAYQPPQIVSPLANCNLEMVDDRAFGTGTLALQSGHANVFKGWLDAAGVANPVYWIRFDDANAERHMQASFSLTEQRADVAAARPGAPLVSGFRLTLPPGVLPVGSYHVYLAVESGGKTYVCDSGRYIDANH